MPYNALDGLANPDLGAQWSNAIMSGMEFARQTKARSALAAYAQNPSMESAAGVIPHDPIMGLNLRRDEEARMAAEQRAQAQQAGAQREQAMKMAQLLDSVTDEQSYQQARNTAQYLGFDLSRVPPNFDPQWVDMQKRIVTSFLDDNDDSLPSLAQEIAAAGYEPGSPEFTEAMRSAIEGKYASEYLGEDGKLRRRSMFNLPSGGPQPGAVEDGYRFKGGDPADQNNWEPLSAAAPGQQTITADEAGRIRQSLGSDAKFQDWKRRNNIVVEGG